MYLCPIVWNKDTILFLLMYCLQLLRKKIEWPQVAGDHTAKFFAQDKSKYLTTVWSRYCNTRKGKNSKWGHFLRSWINRVSLYNIIVPLDRECGTSTPQLTPGWQFCGKQREAKTNGDNPQTQSNTMMMVGRMSTVDKRICKIRQSLQQTISSLMPLEQIFCLNDCLICDS